MKTTLRLNLNTVNGYQANGLEVLRNESSCLKAKVVAMSFPLFRDREQRRQTRGVGTMKTRHPFQLLSDLAVFTVYVYGGISNINPVENQ